MPDIAVKLLHIQLFLLILLTANRIHSTINTNSIFKMWKLSQRLKNLGGDHTASRWQSQRTFEC